MPPYRQFTWKDSNFRICCNRFRLITDTIIHQRAVLEEYIGRHPEFRTSMTPVHVSADAPAIVRQMARAALLTGVGPMAAVAGAIAQAAAEAAAAAGETLIIVDNGGDLFLRSDEPLEVGLFAGRAPVADRLAFRVPPAMMPLAVCSSSGILGHSLSFGQCDLATVVGRDAAVADAAATLAANLVQTAGDIERALERVAAVPGVLGLLIVKDDKIGMKGELPELVPNRDRRLQTKITKDRASGFRPDCGG